MAKSAEGTIVSRDQPLPLVKVLHNDKYVPNMIPYVIQLSIGCGLDMSTIYAQVRLV